MTREPDRGTDLIVEEAERLMNRILEEFSAASHAGVDGTTS